MESERSLQKTPPAKRSAIFVNDSYRYTPMTVINSHQWCKYPIHHWWIGFNRGYGGTFDRVGYTSNTTYKSHITLGCYSRSVKVLYQLDWNDCIVECNHGDVL